MPASISVPPQLAPAPDFRYVGLEAGAARRVAASGAAVGFVMTLGTLLVHGAHALAVAAASGTVTALAMLRAGGPRVGGRGRRAVAMAIVPWGVLVDPDGEGRALRWAAIGRVGVRMIHGRDGGTTTTRWSIVTIETAKEMLEGRASGAVPLERLLAHAGAYADEQAHAVALDLDGERAGDGPYDPEIEPLLASVRAYLHGSAARDRLDLAASYRSSGGAGGSARAIEILRAILRDRAAKSPDPRAFAAIAAAEIGAVDLVDDLVPLVLSPHPVVAAAAKAAARRLGVATARVGTLDEVAPFLDARDGDALAQWLRVSEGAGAARPVG